MQITVLYVGSSLLAPLRNAEREINREYSLDLRVATHNFGEAFTDDEWGVIEANLIASDVVFIIHVMDGENASRLLPLIDRLRVDRAVVVINCMPELMRRTRMGKLDFARLPGGSRQRAKSPGKHVEEREVESGEIAAVFESIKSWIGKQTRPNGSKSSHTREQYLKFADHLPSVLRFVPSAGALRDIKNYVLLFCYFLQPTPTNIRAMLLLALKNYVDDERLKKIAIIEPESLPSVAIYHPEATALFESFEKYEAWYLSRKRKHETENVNEALNLLDPSSTVGLLLMRPQIVSNARTHYDALIRAIEAEGLCVVPAISTLMDNREASEKFFVETVRGQRPEVSMANATDNRQVTTDNRKPRVSQIVSLTGFSFVGGPAMNDSEAAADFLAELNVPYRSLVSLDTQTIESWRDSFTGLNPVQTGMQVAIPEIDGATEPFVFGGISATGIEPAPLEDRCRRIARRLKRWNHLQTTPRDRLKIAAILYCFPPNKGNIGTAADLDVFASLLDILARLKAEGYDVESPTSVNELREQLLEGNSREFGMTANVAYRMPISEYRDVCPFVDEIEKEWGEAPGKLNSTKEALLIQGIHLGNVFIGVQPTFGFEGDPMRLLMAKGGAPHHGFAAFYSYIEKSFRADVVIHLGTHGAMEFMPGKQVGLSSECWPDRLIGELPNIYVYSVNNPSEGTIAKRRSYAELISYLTPPIENAGLYQSLSSLKDLIAAYHASSDAVEQSRLYHAIVDSCEHVHFGLD